MTDDDLVAGEVARLAPYDGDQPTAERKLLELLPVPVAAAILREEALDALADCPNDTPGASGFNPVQRSSWERYLKLEAAVVRQRTGAHVRGPSLWHELMGGPPLEAEPGSLRWARNRRRESWCGEAWHGGLWITEDPDA